MLRTLTILLAALLTMTSSRAQEHSLYELQAYAVADGRLSEVLDVMEQAALPNFERHDLHLLGAFIPLEQEDSKVLLLFSHPNKDHAENAWKSFQTDAAWREALKALTASGESPILNVSRFYLKACDFSPELKTDKDGERVFELRTYFTTPNNLTRLHTRFRDHTLKLFTKHGMNNLIYWSLPQDATTRCPEVLHALSPKGQDTAEVSPELLAKENVLIYFLTHKSREAGLESFGKFRNDPVWQNAMKASEAEAGGSLTVPNGVKSLYLKPAKFSPLQ